MAVYMQVESVTGDVSEKDHKGWIPIQELKVPTSRPDVNTTAGNVTDRTTSQIEFEDIEVTKYMDKASPDLMIWNIQGDTRLVDLHVCKEGGAPVLKLQLENTICTNYESSSDEEGKVEETLALDFTKISYTFCFYDKSNKPAGSKTTGFDLESNKKL